MPRASRSTRPRSSTGAPAPTAAPLVPDHPPPSHGRKHMTESQDHPTGSPQGAGPEAEAGCPVAHDSATSSGSESENPAIDSPAPQTGGRPRTNKDWWPNQLDLSVLHAHTPRANPLG